MCHTIHSWTVLTPSVGVRDQEAGVQAGRRGRPAGGREEPGREAGGGSQGKGPGKTLGPHSEMF